MMISRLRFTTGILVFAVGQATTLLIPFVSRMSLSNEWKTILSGILFFVTPQLGIFLAIAILGKSGYEQLKTMVFRWFKKHVISYQVSRTRYRIGIVLFLIPILFGWISPYVGHIMPSYANNRIIFAVVGDCVFIVSFFVLGGEFWEKLRALFVYNAEVKA